MIEQINNDLLSNKAFTDIKPEDDNANEILLTEGFIKQQQAITEKSSNLWSIFGQKLAN